MNSIDLRRIDLNLLVVFEALMNERHAGRAAERLGLGQPAVSHALARLRRLFNDPLFIRHPRGMEPTKRTLALAPRISDLLNKTRDVFAVEAAFDPQRGHRFTIGQTDGSIPILIKLIERLRATAPNIELHVRRVDSDGIVSAIDTQELDLAFAMMPSERSIRRIVRTPVLTVHYVGLARRGHPFLRGPRTSQAFAALPHLAISPRAEPFSYVDRLFAEMDVRRNVVLTVPHFLAAPHIVASTDLVTVIDVSIAQLFQGDDRLQVFSLPKGVRDITVDMFSASARRDELALSWLRQQCAEVATQISLAGRSERAVTVAARHVR